MKGEAEILLEKRGNTAVITMNRPHRRNALTPSLLLSLAGLLSDLAEEGETRCAVLRGAGDRAFSAGMDLGAPLLNVPDDLQEKISGKGPLQYALETIEECPFPVIAMIRGYCIGAGCETSMACDLRVGAESCRMGMPPARLGIVYPAEGLLRFLRNLGYSTTRKIFLTAEIYDAGEAYRMGMLDYLVPDDDLEDFTMDLAALISSNAPLSLAGHKRSLLLLAGPPEPGAQEKSVLQELVAKALSSEDAREGMTAFREKREPRFRGK